MRPRLPTEGLMEIGKPVYKGPAPFKYFLAIRIPSFLSRGEFDALRLLVYYVMGCVKFFKNIKNKEMAGIKDIEKV